MKAIFYKARRYGKQVKANTFDTPKGKYQIILKMYNDDIYFFKYRDNELLECANLSEKGRCAGVESGDFKCE